MLDQVLIRKCIFHCCAFLSAVVIFLAFSQITLRWDQKQMTANYVVQLSDRSTVTGQLQTDWLGDFQLKDRQGAVIKTFAPIDVVTMVRIGKPAQLGYPWRLLVGLLITLFFSVLVYVSMLHLLKVFAE